MSALSTDSELADRRPAQLQVSEQRRCESAAAASPLHEQLSEQPSVPKWPTAHPVMPLHTRLGAQNASALHAPPCPVPVPVPPLELVLAPLLELLELLLVVPASTCAVAPLELLAPVYPLLLLPPELLVLE